MTAAEQARALIDSFADALRAALREDPDVVLIGEMRDLATIEATLRVAETGHLTFAGRLLSDGSQVTLVTIKLGLAGLVILLALLAFCWQPAFAQVDEAGAIDDAARKVETLTEASKVKDATAVERAIDEVNTRLNHTPMSAIKPYTYSTDALRDKLGAHAT